MARLTCYRMCGEWSEEVGYFPSRNLAAPFQPSHEICLGSAFVASIFVDMTSLCDYRDMQRLSSYEQDFPNHGWALFYRCSNRRRVQILVMVLLNSQGSISRSCILSRAEKNISFPTLSRGPVSSFIRPGRPIKTSPKERCTMIGLRLENRGPCHRGCALRTDLHMCL